MDSSIYHDPHPDVDFVYPCMRCAQRVVLSDSLMTGSNICSFNKDVPCAYCFLQKDVCLPVPPELHCLVQNIVNLVDALDAGNLSANDRLVLVEKGLALGKELRAKWSCYQKKSKKRISADGNGNGNKDEDWIAQNSIFLELTRDAAARQEHTNALLEQQNALLTKQTALLDQLSEKQATQLDRVTELMHQLVSDQAKYCQQMISQPALNVGSLSQGPPIAKQVADSTAGTSSQTGTSSTNPTPSHDTPSSPQSDVTRLLDSFVGKTRKRMNSSAFSSHDKRPQHRSFTG